MFKQRNKRLLDWVAEFFIVLAAILLLGAPFAFIAGESQGGQGMLILAAALALVSGLALLGAGMGRHHDRALRSRPRTRRNESIAIACGSGYAVATVSFRSGAGPVLCWSIAILVALVVFAVRSRADSTPVFADVFSLNYSGAYHLAMLTSIDADLPNPKYNVLVYEPPLDSRPRSVVFDDLDAAARDGSARRVSFDAKSLAACKPRVIVNREDYSAAMLSVAAPSRAAA